MTRSARLFHCARCHCQVIICRRCDRDNVYCFNGCVEQARRSSLQRAGQRCQRSRRGALANAERQRRHRARRQNVTHHGSEPAPAIGGLREVETTRRSRHSTTRPTRPEPRICHGCGRPVGDWLRHRFLKTTGRQRRPLSPIARESG